MIAKQTHAFSHSTKFNFWTNQLHEFLRNLARSGWSRMAEKTVVKEEILEEKDFVVELSGLIDNKLFSTNLEQANFLVIFAIKA